MHVNTYFNLIMTVMVHNEEEVEERGKEEDENNSPHVMSAHFMPVIVIISLYPIISFAQPSTIQGKYGIVFF